MKKSIFPSIFILGLAFGLSFILQSCKKEATQNFSVTKSNEDEATVASVDLGKTIFEGKGNCTSCHQIDQKVIGPSVKDIAKMYTDKKGNIVNFLKEESQPIVDPSQYEVMKTNLALTKTFSEIELKSIEMYIYAEK